VAKELKAQDLIEPPFGYNATGLTGTRRYMAPEVLLSAPYGPPADVFSFAILAWQMLALRRPFAYLDNEEHTKHVAIKGKRPPLLSRFSTLLRDLLAQGWAPDPKLRPSFQDICSTLKVEIVKTSDVSSSILDRSKHLTERSIKSFYYARKSRSDD
jgi:serine/threonine protein kinase